MANLLNINTWNVGTGSVTGFSDVYGTANRFYASGPWSRDELIWRATADGVGTQGNGGWNGSTLNIDITKKYRITTWCNRKVLGTLGQVYHGCYGYDASSTNIGLLKIDTGGIETNPYFYWSSNPPTSNQLPLDTWVMLVGFINPFGYSGTTLNPENGGYLIDGTKLSNTSASFFEFKWQATNAKLAHRIYLYYSYPYTNPIQYFLYPRIDICDGTEPTIQQLLRNKKQTIGLKTSFGSFNIQTKDVISK